MSELKMPVIPAPTPFEAWLKESGRDQYPNFTRQDMEFAWACGGKHVLDTINPPPEKPIASNRRTKSR